MADRYPIGTLADMANIPEDRRDAFIAELPAILRSYQEMQAAAESVAMRTPWPWWIRWLSDEAKVSIIRRGLTSAKSMIWVDDTKGTATISVRATSDGPKIFEETHPLTPTPTNGGRCG